MMNVATELGFEQDDLEDLGSEFREGKCNGNVCNLKLTDMKNFDKFMNSGPKLKDFNDKLKCHPDSKNMKHPNVEIIWNIFPFNYLMAECAYPLEFFCVICNPFYLLFCWCYYPFIWLVVVPWNLLWESILFPFVVCCYPCWWLGWTTYYALVPP